MKECLGGDGGVQFGGKSTCLACVKHWVQSPEPQKQISYHLLLLEFYLYQSMGHGFILLCVHMYVHMCVKTRGQQLSPSSSSSSFQCVCVRNVCLSAHVKVKGQTHEAGFLHPPYVAPGTPTESIFLDPLRLLAGSPPYFLR